MAAILITLVILLPWLGAIVAWLAGNKLPKFQHTLAVVFSVLTALVSLWLLMFATSDPVINIPLGRAFGALTFVPDGLAVSLTAIAAVIGSLAVIFSVDYTRGDEQLGRYYFLVLFFIGAMTGLVLSGNLLFTFFFWEITALCSYGLISFYNDDPKAVAGGMKALIITQVGGVGLLVGTLIAFVNLGSFQISDLLAKASTLPAVSLSLIAFSFLIAAAAKSAQFPFHTWLPDAMEAPTPVSALIHAATMVNAGIYLLALWNPIGIAADHVDYLPARVSTMKFGTMLKDIVDSFFKKSATQLYPFEKIAPPKRYRGALFYDPKACTGCCLCVKDCPSKAIELVILDRAAKRFVLKYHMDRCVYCGQCVVNCKFKCMGIWNEDWEHAVLKKEFTVYYGKEEDIARFMESLVEPAIEADS